MKFSQFVHALWKSSLLRLLAQRALSFLLSEAACPINLRFDIAPFSSTKVYRMQLGTVIDELTGKCIPILNLHSMQALP
jgi:hypothetical protein